MNKFVIHVVGYSGSGKTTFIKKMIQYFDKKNIEVAVIKHDIHGVDIDEQGKDSFVFSEAGAKMSIISSCDTTFFKIHKKMELKNILSMVPDVDMIIIEGFTDYIDDKKNFLNKDVKIINIGIKRKNNNDNFKGNVESLDILITDVFDNKIREFDNNKKIFNIYDVNIVCDYILNLT